MARQILLARDGHTAAFDFSKLERSKLYGQRKRVLLDNAGEPCTRAQLTNDGALLIRAGMSAQGYFDEAGAWVELKELVGLDPEGKPLPLVPSTLGEPQALEGPVDPAELLDLAVEGVYLLDAAELDADLRQQLEAGAIFRFAFNYRPDYRGSQGYLVLNEEGAFAVVGVPTAPEWVELALPPESFDEDDDGFDDDIDFDMF